MISLSNDSPSGRLAIFCDQLVPSASMIKRIEFVDERPPDRRCAPARVSLTELAIVLSDRGAGLGAVVHCHLRIAPHGGRRQLFGKAARHPSGAAKLPGRISLIAPRVCLRPTRQASPQLRVLILPFLGRTDLYHRYRFTEPWNSEHNLEVARDIPKEYRCQSDSPVSQLDTSYVAVTGTGTLWPGSPRRELPKTTSESPSWKSSARTLRGRSLETCPSRH